MLLALKRRIADGLLVAVDVAGVALTGSGAAFVAVLGKFMLAVGASWMACGILIMRKMINFKF